MLKQEYILNVYDVDLAITKQHTGGAKFQQHFESHWEDNLRCFRRLKHHFALMQQQPNCLVSFATFGSFRKRVKQYASCLDITQAPLFIIIGGYNSLSKVTGKFPHIAKILKKYHELGKAIKKVNLFEDDPTNTHNIAQRWFEYISHPDRCECEYLRVAMDAITVEKPVLATQCVDDGETERDELVVCMDEEVGRFNFVETHESMALYCEKLDEFEARILSPSDDMQHELEPTPRTQPFPSIPQINQRNRLTSSCGTESENELVDERPRLVRST